MGTVVTIGLDLAKSVFQVHGVDEEGSVVVRRRLTRAKLSRLDPRQREVMQIRSTRGR